MNNTQKTDLLKKIQQYEFAAYDMLLYLDTHADDTKAFEMYKDLQKSAMRLKNEYKNNFGPLSTEDLASQEQFNWLCSPWPWEACANAKSCKGGVM
ncbi:MAG: spore coat protein CotJB [Clostridia bacterium]|nr:spore coat protein CotJB [Clostridia bacterium]